MGKSTKYTRADKVRIKVRRKAKKFVKKEIEYIDERLRMLNAQISATRQDFSAALFESNISGKQRDIWMNLLQNNNLEFQAEAAELYARKDKLRTEFVARGDDLADLLAQLERVPDNYSMVDEPNVGC